MQEQKEHCHCGHHQNEHHHEGEHCCGEGHHHQKGHSQGPEISCGCGHCHEKHGEQGEEMTLKKIIIALVLCNSNQPSLKRILLFQRIKL